jgi:uncharacterized protein
VTANERASALEVNVAGLLAEGPGVIHDIDVRDLRIDLGPDLVQGAPIDGSIRLSRTNRGLFVSGRLRTSLRESCVRCLADVEVPIDIVLDEEALPSIDLHSGAPLDATVDPEVVRLTDHHEIDLEALLRDAISLAEPIAPVCRPDCPGLCVVCGGELAVGDHDHGEGPIDPRLEALRAFRVDENGRSG